MSIRDVVGTQIQILQTAESEILNTGDEIYNPGNKTFGLPNDSLLHKIQIYHMTSIDTKKTRCLQLQLKVVSNLHLLSQVYFNHNFFFVIIYPLKNDF